MVELPNGRSADASRPRRIVFVLPDLAGGGAQRVMLRFAGALDPARWDATVLSLGRATTYASEVPAHLELVTGGFARVRSGLPWLVREIDRRRPAVVVGVMGYVNLALLGLRPLLRSKPRIVVREANMLGPTLEALPRWLPGRLAYRMLYPTADVIVAPSARVAGDLAAVVPGARGLVEVCPNPVDEDALRARVTAGGPRGDGLHVVAAGRLGRQKAFGRLIEALALLPPPARLVLYGEGSDRAALEGLARSLGVADRVSLPGFSTALPSAIAAADVFALTSRWEGLPNVALEALALGTPVVATPECGLEEVAALCPPGAVTIALPGKDLAHALAARQPSRAESPIRPSLLPSAYRVENACARFASVLDNLIGS